MHVTILLFDGLTALDAIGPYEVLWRLPDTTVEFAAPAAGTVRTDNGILGLTANVALEDVRGTDILVVPGGFGTRPLMTDEPVLQWVRAVHATTQWTTSVCTGSLVLGAAGLLTDLPATTHWAATDILARTGARPTSQRVVEAGKIITAAGVSAGIDLALMLAARVAGEDVAKAIQLSIEYDPQPPFDAGSPEKAGPAIRELAAGAVRPSTAQR